MQIKKIIAVAAAFVMAAGIGGAFPENSVFEDVSITASAAASDFTVKTDKNGVKYVAGYKGKGGNITIPSEAAYIGKGAFEGNTSITGVTIPKNCVLVEECAFNCCTELKKVVFEGDASIGVFAFSNCVNLESVAVKGSIIDGIYNGAFSECQSLKTVKISGNNHKFIIDFYAFFDCYSLTSVNIPSNCTKIYGCAFLNCFNLTNLTIPSKTEIVTDSRDNNYQFGYARIFPTKEDCIAHEEGRDYKTNTFVAGEKSMYSQKYSSDPTGEYSMLYDVVYYTPKAITLTVTKGSSAEKWAKNNKVKYVYASSSSSSSSSSGDKLAAPTGLKASAKTKSSVTLTWNSISGADAYRVYIYDSSTGKYVKYKDVSGTKCTVNKLSSGTTYKFKVAALEEVNGKYQAGNTSKAISAKTKS